METGQTTANASNLNQAVLSCEAPARQLETRSSARTNLFVAAVLYSEDGNCPVKVRNLSECGGLVEASTLPAAGTDVRLCRGSLVVPGKVVWQRAGRAGLRFASAITVADWLPNNHSRHQSRVDDLVHQVRTGRADHPDTHTAEASSKAASASNPVNAIASAIERLADELAADPYMIANHSWKLQQLEMTVQQLRRVVATAL